MPVSNHHRHAHAQPHHHAHETDGVSPVRGVLRRGRAGRHGRATTGANVRRLGVGVLAVSLSTGLVVAPAALAVVGRPAGTIPVSVPTESLAAPLTAPAGAAWTLPDSSLPQVVLPVAAAPAAAPSPAPAPSPAALKQYAASLVGAGQFRCLDKLWSRESGWDPAARNASSGAFGIPQSLPGSKMAAAGADWATNPLTQVRWGVAYIRSSYGTPCGAWAHSQATGWY